MGFTQGAVVLYRKVHEARVVKADPNTESFVVAVKILCAPHSLTLSQETGSGGDDQQQQQQGQQQPAYKPGETLQYLRPDGKGYRAVTVVQVLSTPAAAAAAADQPPPTPPAGGAAGEGGEALVGMVLGYYVEYEVETTAGHLTAS